MMLIFWLLVISLLELKSIAFPTSLQGERLDDFTNDTYFGLFDEGTLHPLMSTNIGDLVSGPRETTLLGLETREVNSSELWDANDNITSETVPTDYVKIEEANTDLNQHNDSATIDHESASFDDGSGDWNNLTLIDDTGYQSSYFQSETAASNTDFNYQNMESTDFKAEQIIDQDDNTLFQDTLSGDTSLHLETLRLESSGDLSKEFSEARDTSFSVFEPISTDTQLVDIIKDSPVNTEVTYFNGETLNGMERIDDEVDNIFNTGLPTEVDEKGMESTNFEVGEKGSESTNFQEDDEEEETTFSDGVYFESVTSNSQEMPNEDLSTEFEGNMGSASDATNIQKDAETQSILSKEIITNENRDTTTGVEILGNDKIDPTAESHSNEEIESAENLLSNVEIETTVKPNGNVNLETTIKPQSNVDIETTESYFKMATK